MLLSSWQYKLRYSPIVCSYPSILSQCSHTKQYFLWNCQILRSKRYTHYDAVEQHPFILSSLSHWSYEQYFLWKFPILRSNLVVLLYWQVKFLNCQRLILWAVHKVVSHCKSRPSQYELYIPWKELDLFACGRQSSKSVWYASTKNFCFSFPETCRSNVIVHLKTVISLFNVNYKLV
jgi:hypothetical protein